MSVFDGYLGNEPPFVVVIESIGRRETAEACGVTRQAVEKWLDSGLPQTEYLPKSHPKHTRYATVIARMAKCKRSDLL